MTTSVEQREGLRPVGTRRGPHGLLWKILRSLWAVRKVARRSGDRDRRAGRPIRSAPGSVSSKTMTPLFVKSDTFNFGIIVIYYILIFQKYTFTVGKAPGAHTGARGMPAPRNPGCCCRAGSASRRGGCRSPGCRSLRTKDTPVSDPRRRCRAALSRYTGVNFQRGF